MLELASKNLTREAIEEISRQKNEPEWLLEKRLQAFSQFERLELPDFSYGLATRLDATELDINEINPFEHSSEIKIKNPAHQLVVKDLNEALKTHEELIKKYFLTTTASNKLEALTSAFWSKGLFIYVPKGAEATLEIESTLNGQNFLETILVVAEPFSKLTLIESQNSKVSTKSYSLQNVEVFGKESSKIEFGCIQNLEENVLNFSSRTAFLEKDSSADWIICDMGGGFTKSDVTTNLAGPGASVNNIGIFLGRNKQQFDFSLNSIHSAPDTSCEMLTKGALTDKSKGVYGGLIKIKQGAPRSEGYQKADILLLSPDAEAAPMPNLEIETNDVKRCTHGATVGQVDKEKLFYLMSRGLSEKEAIKKIVEGLLEPAVEKIKIEKIQNHLRELIDERLK